MSTTNTKEEERDLDDDGSIIRYLNGLGNEFESSVLPNGNPIGRNNPRLVPYNCITEQISGTAFTVPRADNLRTWLYRIQPSTANGKNFLPILQQQQQQQKDSNDYYNYPKYLGHCNLETDLRLTPNPLRWKPMKFNSATKDTNVNFINGLHLLAMSSSKPLDKNGIAIYTYCFNKSMHDNNSTNIDFMNSDGDFLIVPQLRSLKIITELGIIIVHPQQICVIPRGIVFAINLLSSSSPSDNNKNENEKEARGYVLELYKGHFKLPDLGPIGSNGLANARDFQIPTAWFVDTKKEYNQSCKIINKFGSELFIKNCPHSPYNVIAWHGNYVPFKYDLNKFCVINSVSYDHIDPSIYTVLTAFGGNTETPSGTAMVDFVIFPSRFMSTDSNTFRPPWYHRNTMTEFMGLISGNYDAKVDFVPGGASLHSCMTPHGPDTTTYTNAINDKCEKPEYFDKGLAFMFETSLMLYVTKQALGGEGDEAEQEGAPKKSNDQSSSSFVRDIHYEDCWDGLEKLSDSFFDQLEIKKEHKK